ncbi:MAG: transglutaminase domain-containing protein [Clostridiales bacterium]|nr:transglutaminase domain-containing protein [Clostridiales bacterium]
MALKSKKKKTSRREKKIEAYRNELSKKTGIAFSQQIEGADASFPYLKYAVNALILFFSVFGTYLCVVTSFSLNVGKTPLLITCAAFSMIFSFMYIANPAKIITYLLVLVSIIAGGLRYFVIINSGLSAVLNSCLKKIDSVSSLPFLREFPVFYEDTGTAMTVSLCIVAAATMLIVNIFVSEKMKLVMLCLITGTISQSGMYFGLKASTAGMVMLATSWGLVLIIKFTGAYNGLTSSMQSTSSIKKHRHSYGFVTDSVNVSKIAVLWLVFIFAISALTFLTVSSESFDSRFAQSALKASSERQVKNFLSYGFDAFRKSDGLSNEAGRLSDSDSISFDGKPDLKVTLVNYKVDRMYLRSFVGYTFDNAGLRWQRGDISIDGKSQFMFTANLLKNDFEGERNLCKSKHKIGVRIADSRLIGTPLNVPYYSLLDGNFRCIGSGEAQYSLRSVYDNDDTVYYTVYTLDEETQPGEAMVTPDAVTSVAVIEDAYSNALYVPDEIKPDIEAFCKEYGINKDDPGVINAVVAALEENYEYTLRPGKMPPDRNYISYFLTENKKGYCQHYASAAVMIFRYLGIPARYAEGYAVDSIEFLSAQTVSGEDASEWIDADYVTDSVVKTVSVPDSKRHAWVEVFDNQIGWRTVEATLAMAVDDGGASSSQGGGLLSRLFGSLSLMEDYSGSETVSSDSLTGDGRDSDEDKTVFGALALTLVSIAFAFYLFLMLKRVLPRHLSFNSNDDRKNAFARYSHLYETAVYYDKQSFKNASVRELSDKMESLHCLEGIAAGGFCEKIEKVLYGPDFTKDEYDFVIEKLKSSTKLAFKKMSFKRKIGYIFFSFMF